MVKFLNEEIVKHLQIQERITEDRIKHEENAFLGFFYLGRLMFYVEQIDKFCNGDNEIVDPDYIEALRAKEVLQEKAKELNKEIAVNDSSVDPVLLGKMTANDELISFIDALKAYKVYGGATGEEVIEGQKIMQGEKNDR